MDKNAQLEELDSLKSIYYSEEFQVNENADGKGPIQAVFWAFVKPQENYKLKYLQSLDSMEPSYMILKHLPPIELQLTLPDNYPSKNPPQFVITCQWLNKAKISKLCKKLDEIWTEYGCVEIIYAWCDFLKNDSLSFLGSETELDITDLCSKHLNFTEKMQRNMGQSRMYNENTYMKHSDENAVEKEDELEKNSDLLKTSSDTSINWKSTKRLKNNHKICKKRYPYFKRNNWSKNSQYKRVYEKRFDKRAVLNLSLKMSPLKILENYNIEREKKEFLRNFYTCNICFSDKMGKDCIQFKDCNHVFCTACVRSYFTVKIKDGSVQSIKCPSDRCSTEALPSQIKEIVSEELFARYDSVLLSTALDTFNDIIYCPRSICQYPVSWEPDEKMALCPNCQYVFCVSCKMVYHGVEPCQYKPGEVQKLVEKYENGTQEEKLLLEKKYGKKQIEGLINNAKAESWIKDNSKPCPKCNIAIEKSQGCNKMVCWKCGANFCWLCCSILDPKNPYFHYNDPQSRCANKLFHLVYNFEEEEEEYEWDWFWIDDSEDDSSDMDFEEALVDLD